MILGIFIITAAITVGLLYAKGILIYRDAMIDKYKVKSYPKTLSENV